MQPSSKKLQRYRRMGSMEQIFTALYEHKVDSWGCAGGVSEITNLSEVPLEKIQNIWNKIHYKYESFGAQIFHIPSVYKYDWIYLGCLPFNIIKYDDNRDIDQLLKKELNHRYLILNDLNITESDISAHNYNICNIPPLYRFLICGNNWIITYHHSTFDGMSLVVVFNDFLKLLNGEFKDKDFDEKTIQKYTSIEQNIDPKYAKSSFINKFINYCIPGWFGVNFNKWYCNNEYLSTLNPLQFHRDDILRSRYNFARNRKDFVAFPLCSSYDRYNYRIDYERFSLSKNDSLNLKALCKSNGAHISSLFQYIVNAAMIECHPHQLPNSYYKTVIGNVFSALPLYREPNKIAYGIHACAYYNIVEYDKNIEIGCNKFWNIIRKISKNLLDRDKDSKRIRNIYKKKFPYLNTKKFLNYTYSDKSNFGGICPMPPTVTNPGVFNLNKKHWRYKVIKSYGGSNPGVGLGAMYLLSAGTVQNIDEMCLVFCYGIQFISKQKAKQIATKMKQIMEQIAALPLTVKSKL